MTLVDWGGVHRRPSAKGVWCGRSLIGGVVVMFEGVVVMAVMNNKSETRMILRVALDIATAQLGIVSLKDMAFVKVVIMREGWQKRKSMSSKEFGMRNISHCALRLDRELFT